MAKKNKVATEAIEETTVTEVVEETTDTGATKPKFMPTGVVDGCARLNVRSNPSATASVVCVIDASTKVKIAGDSDKDFYEVKLADGKQGFCMKKYIKLK